MNAAIRAAECRAILGGERDPFRIVWDEQATPKDRRLLLAMAGEPAQAAAMRSGYAWCDLSGEMRGKVLAALKRFGAWAERLQ